MGQLAIVSLDSVIARLDSWEKTAKQRDFENLDHFFFSESCHKFFFAIKMNQCLECPPSLWGANCIHHCLCMHDGSCNSKTGDCTCAAGWTGPACEFLCPFGQYGLNCELRCDCMNGANCNRTTGQCECLPGWRGERYGRANFLRKHLGKICAFPIST
ncbi:unnamed protein product [Cylicostephanus goldi]|uniref:EGF-like domain-containing protein n=1 Tax=Cylicostephanus goldi TaxID=71465 RepID=A0A3P6SDB4_CYLGO|nr:unnamed protein product [Cylicostephanus goldi]